MRQTALRALKRMLGGQAVQQVLQQEALSVGALHMRSRNVADLAEGESEDTEDEQGNDQGQGAEPSSSSDETASVVSVDTDPGDGAGDKKKEGGNLSAKVPTGKRDYWTGRQQSPAQTQDRVQAFWDVVQKCLEELPGAMQVQDSAASAKKSRLAVAQQAAEEVGDCCRFIQERAEIVAALLREPLQVPLLNIATTALNRRKQLQLCLPLNLVFALHYTVAQISQAGRRSRLQGARVCLVTMGADAKEHSWLASNPAALLCQQCGLLVVASAGVVAAPPPFEPSQATGAASAAGAGGAATWLAPEAQAQAAASPAHKGLPLAPEEVVRHWHASKAKNTAYNLAVRCCGPLDDLEKRTAIIINGDVDNVLGGSFLDEVCAILRQWAEVNGGVAEPPAAAVAEPPAEPSSSSGRAPRPEGPAGPPEQGGPVVLPTYAVAWVAPKWPGVTGRIASTVLSHCKLLGYDEDAAPSGGQDIDLRSRLLAAAKEAGTKEPENICVAAQRGGFSVPQDNERWEADRNSAKISAVAADAQTRYGGNWATMNKENLATFRKRLRDGLIVRNHPGGSAPNAEDLCRLGYRFKILTSTGLLAKQPVWAEA